MKYAVILLLSILLYINLNAKEHYDFDLKVGFLSSGTLLSSFKDARFAVHKWLDSVAAMHNGKIDVTFQSNSKTLFKELKNNHLDMVALNLNFFFENKKEIMNLSEHFWSLSMNNSKFKEYYLISQKSLNAKNFKFIKNRSISLKKSDEVALIWLDKNSLIENKKPFSKIVKHSKYYSKETTALLNVFFKKSDFAIITKHTWDVMVELNPAIEKKLEIIKKSKKIYIPFIGVFSKQTKIKYVNTFFKLSDNLKNLKGSKQIIDLLKFDSIFKVNKESLKILDEYYSEYFILKKKYQ